MLRPLVIWPFPETRVRELAQRVKGFLVVELNYGQISFEVERIVAARAHVSLLGHGGGTVHEPEDVLDEILRVAHA
jgi:2-oxoglutarate ferredoxin oxidoreductase subunit alpha